MLKRKSGRKKREKGKDCAGPLMPFIPQRMIKPGQVYPNEGDANGPDSFSAGCSYLFYFFTIPPYTFTSWRSLTTTDTLKS